MKLDCITNTCTLHQRDSVKSGQCSKSVRLNQTDELHFYGETKAEKQERKHKGIKKFVHKVHEDILKEIGIENGPKLTIEKLPLPGFFEPNDGTITLDEDDLCGSLLRYSPLYPLDLGSIIRHELKHFEQCAMMVRLPDGIDKLWAAVEQQAEKIKMTADILKERCIYDVGKWLNPENAEKRAQKKEALMKLLDKVKNPDLEKFRDFWTKVRNEMNAKKGELTLEEFIEAKKYLKAYQNYPNSFEAFMCKEDRGKFIHRIKADVTCQYNYLKNNLEHEAINTGFTYSNKNIPKLIKLYRQAINSKD